MRQTEVENMLKDHEDRLKVLEEQLVKKPVLVKVKDNEIESIKEITEKLTTKVEHPKVITKIYQEDKIPDVDLSKVPEELKNMNTDTSQENDKQSVESKGLPITKEGVSTTESGDGESPVETKIKKTKK